MKKKCLVMLLCGLAPAVSHGEGLGVSAKVSTLGLGVDFVKPISENLNGRIGLNAFNYNFSGTKSSNNYNIKLKLQSVEALADYFPWSGAFRASFGLLYNNNKASMDATPGAGSTYTVNGKSYAAGTGISSLNGNMSFNSIAPYVGIGWGNPVAQGKGWGFVADLGVLYQGSPKVSLAGTCGSATVGTAACTTIQSNIAAEQANVQSSLHSFSWYPVASIGASYQF